MCGWKKHLTLWLREEFIEWLGAERISDDDVLMLQW